VFENRALRKIFGHEGDKELEKMQNEGHHNTSSNIIRLMRWAVHVDSM
jgi:hypothetical protein